MRITHSLTRKLFVGIVILFSFSLVPVTVLAIASPATSSTVRDSGGGRLFTPPQQEDEPEANFSAEPTAGFAPLEVEFYDESIPGGGRLTPGCGILATA